MSRELEIYQVVPLILLKVVRFTQLNFIQQFHWMMSFGWPGAWMMDMPLLIQSKCFVANISLLIMIHIHGFQVKCN